MNYIDIFLGMNKSKKENFLKIIYNLSDDNKNTFLVWGNKEHEVISKLKTKIDKITFKENFNYKKRIKVSKINEILKNSKSYPLSNNGLIKLYYKICINIIEFISKKNWGTLAIEKSCARYISQYLDLIREIPETSERNELEEKITNKLEVLTKDNKYIHLNKFLLSLKNNFI